MQIVQETLGFQVRRIDEVELTRQRVRSELAHALADWHQAPWKPSAAAGPLLAAAEEARKLNEPVEITYVHCEHCDHDAPWGGSGHTVPCAQCLAAADETAAILSDPETMAAIAEGEEEL